MKKETSIKLISKPDKIIIRKKMGLGPSLPMIKTPGFYCRWRGFDPWPPTKIGHFLGHGRKKRETEREK